MAENYLYMFEIVVDDLLITQPNECAPEEYPTCVTIEFRDYISFSICDRDFGGCMDTRVKNGKCVLFGLDSPMADDEKIFVVVAKKKIEKCKFLLGATEVPVKTLFEKVTEDFINENPYISQLEAKKKKDGKTDAQKDDEEDMISRPEEYCPASVISKKLLSLFDKKGRQTGNIVLVLRLSCMGPTIVSPFPFGSAAAGKDRMGDSTECCVPPKDNSCCMPCKPQRCPVKKKSKKKANICEKLLGSMHDECCCDECEMDCEIESSSTESLYPCFATPRKPKPGPEAFDEFEANFNGSGLTVRVLKDKHQVVDVCDSDSDYETDSNDSYNSGRKDKCSPFKPKDPCRPCDPWDPCNPCKPGDPCNPCDPCGLVKRGHHTKPFVINEIKKNTGGKFVNRKGLPRIQGNLKYRGNEQCGTDFELPIQIKPCGGEDKVGKYRKMPPESRNCCLQVQGNDIDKSLKGLNKNGPPGIEICHAKNVETDADVFLLKLGRKQKCKDKENLIQIELRTPKEPLCKAPQKISRDAQADDYDIDEAMKDICAKKGKKGKKGKGKGKGGKGGKGKGKGKKK